VPFFNFVPLVKHELQTTEVRNRTKLPLAHGALGPPRHKRPETIDTQSYRQAQYLSTKNLLPSSPGTRLRHLPVPNPLYARFEVVSMTPSPNTAPENLLAEIIARRRESIAQRQRVLPLVALKMAVEKKPLPVRDFRAAIDARPGGAVIAEIKRASPSRGILRQHFVPSELALELSAAGAAALSVITEEDYFQGSLVHLKDARASVGLPVLRKDFILDPWQVWESRAIGADSFLLIASALEDQQLAELLDLGRQLGMEPLVEVHSLPELARALAAGATILGVNSRNLTTFEVRLETALELVGQIPVSCTSVAESGIHSREDLQRLRSAGYDAFLIGESLMAAASPGVALRALLGEAPQETAK
jgi:indole-3-glycerol phosphate synthase